MLSSLWHLRAITTSSSDVLPAFGGVWLPFGSSVAIAAQGHDPSGGLLLLAAGLAAALVLAPVAAATAIRIALN